jgi:hypothetical protein
MHPGEGGPGLHGRFACFAWLALVPATHAGDSFTQSVKGKLLLPWLAATFAREGVVGGEFPNSKFLLLGSRLAMFHGMCIMPLAPAH